MRKSAKPAADGQHETPPIIEQAEPSADEAAQAAAAEGAPETLAEPVSQLTRTQIPIRNTYGLELDRFGLPVNGPARAAVLAQMDVADPALEPGDWDFRDGERAAKVMENIYG